MLLCICAVCLPSMLPLRQRNGAPSLRRHLRILTLTLRGFLFLWHAGTISSAAYGLMASLFSPQHGCMAAMAAAVLPRLTLLIVGSGSPAAGKRSAAEVAADRSAALNFVKDAFRWEQCVELGSHTQQGILCGRSMRHCSSRQHLDSQCACRQAASACCTG